MNWTPEFLAKVKINASLADSIGQSTNIIKKFTSIEIIELCVNKPIITAMLYITAKAAENDNIEYKKFMLQYPDFNERINHMEPIRNTMLKPTNAIAPRNLEISIFNRDSGLEIRRSIFPLSTIEGMNDDADIREKKSISGNEKVRKPDSAAITKLFLSPSEAIPSTLPVFTKNSITSITMA